MREVSRAVLAVLKGALGRGHACAHGQLEALPEESVLKSREDVEHIARCGVAPHQAHSPELRRLIAQPAADLRVVVAQQHPAGLIAVDSLRHHHGR